jgi:ankyrin repeat protein
MAYSKYFIIIAILFSFLKGSAQFDPEYMKMVIGFTTYIQTNNMDSLQSMIDDGYSPNFQDKDKKMNPLHYAIEADRPQAIKKLIENGADWSYFNQDNKSARTELQIKYPELFKELNSVRIRSKQFLLSIQEGKFNETNELLNHESVKINFKWKDQSNALHFLLKYNLNADKPAHSFEKYKLFEELLNRNINAKVFNSEKEYPLFLAMEYYPAKYSKLLLEKDSSLAYKDLSQFAYYTSIAIDSNAVNIAFQYIKNANLLSSNGKTMLYNALKYNELDNAVSLIRKGAELELENKDGLTVLNEIVVDKDSTFDKIPSIELLIKHNANINTKDKNGVTPLIHAVYNRDIELSKLLVDAGANVNYVGKGVIAVENALHAAVSRADIAMVDFLIEAGAKNDVLDELGKTPLDKAKNAYNFHKEQEQKEKAEKFKKIMKLLK